MMVNALPSESNIGSSPINNCPEESIRASCDKLESNVEGICSPSLINKLPPESTRRSVAVNGLPEEFTIKIPATTRFPASSNRISSADTRLPFSSNINVSPNNRLPFSSTLSSSAGTSSPGSKTLSNDLGSVLGISIFCTLSTTENVSGIEGKESLSKILTNQGTVVPSTSN